jgi:holo-[acyl-carrier protein] synthase
MIRGIGVDIVSVSRIERLMDKYGEKILRRILSGHERENMPRAGAAEYVASRFALREALVKATGWKDLHYPSVTVSKDESGRPYLEGEAFGRRQVDPGEFQVSLSHEREYAVAFVVWVA